MSQKLEIGSWNGVLMHILKEYMKEHPLNKPLRESPFFSFQHSSYNDLVDNPFALPDSIETDVLSEQIEPAPKPEPKPEPTPEPEQPQPDEPEDEIFTI